MTTQDKPAVGPLSAGDVKLLVKGDLLSCAEGIGAVGVATADYITIYINDCAYSRVPSHFAFIGRPDADGWMPWSGGENPVGEAVVDTRHKNGIEQRGWVAQWGVSWLHDDYDSAENIIAFRLAPTAPVETLGETPAFWRKVVTGAADVFSGDNAALVASINALLDLPDSALSHRVPGLAKQLLASAARRLPVQSDIEPEPRFGDETAGQIVKRWADWINDASDDMEEPEWGGKTRNDVLNERDFLIRHLSAAQPDTGKVEASGSERESEAWEWLGQLYPNDAPSDLAYDANEMIDAFLAGSGRSDRMAKALERIAGEQQYRSGYCQTDITVEPALSADEAQTVAREALAHNPALRPQPSGETREIVEALEFYASAFDWHPGDGEAPDATHPGSPPTYYEASATDELIEDAGKRARTALALITPAPVASGGQHSSGEAFQPRVHQWLLDCFGWEIAGDRQERGDRLLEEVLELLQSGGYDPARVAALRDYVWGRPVGEPAQEVGGVMVTLAAYCVAHDLDMMGAGQTELARIVQPEIVKKIRAKQAAKPTGSALPIAVPAQDDDKLRIAVEALEYYAGPHALPNEGPWGASSDDYGRRAAETLRVLQSNATGWADVKCRQCGVAFGLHLPSCLRPSVSDEDQ